MHNVYPAAAIILAEICIALLAIVCVMIYSTLRHKRNNRVALEKLTENIKQKEGERLTSLKTMLKEVYHYSDDKLDELASGVIKTEMVFYQELMNIFSSREGASMENFDQKIDQLMAAYRNLTPQPGSQPANEGSTVITQVSDADALSSKLAQLKAENEKLTQALDSTKQELEDTVSEFSKTFSGGQEGSESIITTDKTSSTPDKITTTPVTGTQQKDKPSNVEPQKTIKAEDSAKSKSAAPITSDQEDNDLLKDFDIDFSDINIDDDDTTKQPHETQKSGDNIDIDIGDINIDIPGIDQTPDKTSSKNKL